MHNTEKLSSPLTKIGEGGLIGAVISISPASGAAVFESRLSNHREKLQIGLLMEINFHSVFLFIGLEKRLEVQQRSWRGSFYLIVEQYA